MWPEPTHAKNPLKGQQKWKTATDCIDFSDLGKSIFGRKKDLAPATLRRVAKGMKKFVIDNPAPFIVPIANLSGETVQPAFEPTNRCTPSAPVVSTMAWSANSWSGLLGPA